MQLAQPGAVVLAHRIATVFFPNIMGSSVAVNEFGMVLSFATDAGKNSRHGDGGRAGTKAEGQIADLEKQLKNASNRKEKERISRKIKNIREDAQRKKKGVEHSKGNKR
ncbi:MAG: hypothetical protein H0X63_13145 [Flavobacteriales bacterium]|nr:hypothetical protein [Flavobacteriales bacterium]